MNGKKSDIFTRRTMILFFLVFLVIPVAAQVQTPVPVTISGEKIVVEGKVYYMHQVLKGQTLYSIARAYTVPVDMLSRENNLNGNAIKEGQVIRIPAAAVAQGQAAQAGRAGQQGQQGQPGQQVQPGQQGQPGQGGTVRSQTSVAGSPQRSPQSPSTQDERYIYHRVRRDETLGTIAGEYGISVRDLKRANRGLLFPHEGDYLLIPRNKITDPDAVRRSVEVSEVVPQDTVPVDTVDVDDEPEFFTIPVEKTSIDRLSGSVRVAVLFPFFLKENSIRTYIDSTGRDSRGNTIYREVTRNPADIYDGSLPFLEAYEGILIAADSLRALGLTVELDIYDTGADSTELKKVLRSGLLDRADLIIGPVFSHNLEQISWWASERNIPVVSPVALRDAHIHEDKPYLYRVFPSQNVAQDVMAGELERHPDSRIVFLYADSAMYDPATVRLWDKVTAASRLPVGDAPGAGPVNRFNDTSVPVSGRPVKDTSGVVPGKPVKDTSGIVPGRHVKDTSAPVFKKPAYDTSRVVSHWFTGTTAKRDTYGSITSLESLLDPERENVIVLASTSTPVVSSVFSALHTLAKKYNIRVIGYPEIRGLETIDLKYYYDLELLIPAESYIDYESSAVQSFTASFMKKFRTEPMAESFAWRGFDIAWYFIGGIATGGREFLRDPGTFNPALLCLEPDFRRDSRQEGYENRGLFILQYRKNMTIEIRRPWKESALPEEYQDDRFSSPFSGSSGRSRVR